MSKKTCQADGGKHRWKYRDDSMLGPLRECQKCGVLEQKRQPNRWVQIGTFRTPPTMAL